MKPTLDILQIIAAGAMVSVDASTRPTLDLMQMASAAANRGVRLTIRNVGSKPTLDLQRIAAAGRGHVMLEL